MDIGFNIDGLTGAEILDLHRSIMHRIGRGCNASHAIGAKSLYIRHTVHGLGLSLAFSAHSCEERAPHCSPFNNVTEQVQEFFNARRSA